MNRLRKIAQWLWLAKERFVLAVMVVLLSFRIYAILNPSSLEDSQKVFAPPRTELTEDVKTPGLPPRAPVLDRSEDWSALFTRDMFIYEKPKESTSLTRDGETSTLTVLRIREGLPGSGKFRVQIQTEAAAKKWYSVGDAFETYTLLAVDLDTQCCEIFDDRLGRRIEVCVE